MNLWRRSKSWFQESFPSQKENFEPQDYLEQEKRLLNAKYEHERGLIEKQFHYEMLDAKLRFENELSRLQDEHCRLKAKNRNENDTIGVENDASSSVKASTKGFKTSPSKKNAFVEDGLEWDPINELKSYSENETLDSWEVDQAISLSDSFVGEEIRNTEFRDSAYGSISMELQRKSFTEEEPPPTMKKFKASDVERRIEQLRASIRQEITREYDEKFREERKFLYSVIDELEENVALLRKQKEDIVTIFEAEEKGSIDVDEKSLN